MLRSAKRESGETPCPHHFHEVIMSTGRPRVPPKRKPLTPQEVEDLVRARKESNAANRRGPGSYRCVYCKTGFTHIRKVLDHEKVCPSRRAIERTWEKDLAKHRRRENLDGDKEKR